MVEPVKTTKIKKYTCRRIDRTADIIEIRFGDAKSGEWNTWLPVALVEKPRNGELGVELLLPPNTAKNRKILASLSEELNFYFFEKKESDPWAYACYHCTTFANLYSPLHWSHFPLGHQASS